MYSNRQISPFSVKLHCNYLTAVNGIPVVNAVVKVNVVFTVAMLRIGFRDRDRVRVSSG